MNIYNICIIAIYICRETKNKLPEQKVVEPGCIHLFRVGIYMNTYMFKYIVVSLADILSVHARNEYLGKAIWLKPISACCTNVLAWTKPEQFIAALDLHSPLLHILAVEFPPCNDSNRHIVQCDEDFDFANAHMPCIPKHNNITDSDHFEFRHSSCL